MSIPNLRFSPLCLCAVRERLSPELITHLVCTHAWAVAIPKLERSMGGLYFHLDSLAVSAQQISRQMRILEVEMRPLLERLRANPEQEALYKKKPWLRLQDEHTRNKAKQRKVR